jgi:hypothetical protein
MNLVCVESLNVALYTKPGFFILLPGWHHLTVLLTD